MKLIIFLLLFHQAWAEDSAQPDFLSQVGRDLVTPVTTKANRILGGSLLAAGMVYMNKGKRSYDKIETFRDAQPLGQFGVVGDVAGWGFLNGIYFLGQFSLGTYKNDPEALAASEHMLKASAYTLLVTGALKAVVNERRPGYPEDKHSFPSGHSSMSFAFASVVAARHGWFWGGLSYGAATYISVSRINDDWHYLHDVLVGMGIGASYGWGLHYAYEKELPVQFAVIPLPDRGLMGAMEWKF